MRDEELREEARAITAGGRDDKAARVLRLISDCAPCKACGGSRAHGVDIDAVAPINEFGSMGWPCHVCLGTGLAIDQNRVRLAAWLGDEVAKQAVACSFCGGSRVIGCLEPAATSAQSSVCIPLLAANRYSGAGDASVMTIWPDYVACVWCGPPRTSGAFGFLEALAERLRVCSDPEEAAIPLVVAMGCAAYRLSVPSGDELEDIEIMEDWSRRPTRRVSDEIHRRYRLMGVREQNRDLRRALLGTCAIWPMSRHGGLMWFVERIVDSIKLQPLDEHPVIEVVSSTAATWCMGAISWD